MGTSNIKFLLYESSKALMKVRIKLQLLRMFLWTLQLRINLDSLLAITIQKTIQCVGVYQDVSKAYGLLDNTDFNLGLKKNRDMTWDPVFRRLRCNGHVIDLSAQSFLFPKLADGEKDKSDDYTTDASILRDINGKLPPREFNQ